MLSVKNIIFVLSLLITGNACAQVTLVCNDLVTYPLSPVCVDTIDPDVILEGTYSNYNDFYVEFDKTIPYGNGPWVIGIASTDDINMTYQVRVTHTLSGNKCWGNIKIAAPSIEAGFNTSADNLLVTFDNESFNALTYLWDFGDGTTSTEANPSHLYNDPGSYTVSLIASNQCLTDSVTMTVHLVSSVNNLYHETRVLTYPNPASSNLFIVFTADNRETVICRLYDTRGNIVQESQTDINPGENQLLFNRNGLPAGIYWLYLSGDTRNFVRKILFE